MAKKFFQETGELKTVVNIVLTYNLNVVSANLAAKNRVQGCNRELLHPPPPPPPPLDTIVRNVMSLLLAPKIS